MKIPVADIPDEGMTLFLSPKDRWVAPIVTGTLPPLGQSFESFSGQADLSKVEETVTIKGEVALALDPPCDRCGEGFSHPLKAVFRLDLVPRRGFVMEQRTRGDKEVELTPEDLEFGFYDEDEIDLSRIVGEQLVLALPIRFLCSPDCKGLCPKCGTNLNEEPCSCAREEILDSPLKVLKTLKPKL